MFFANTQSRRSGYPAPIDRIAESSQQGGPMLSAFRVLDLTDERGIFAGMLLASLGADVIAIEPPAGSKGRRTGPFIADVPGPERSLYHWSYNQGKKSVVLDICDLAEHAKFLDLVRGADILVENFDPSFLSSVSLGYEELSKINPALVHTSITAFGSDGPKAHWASTDLTLMAAAGVSTLAGDADRAPVRISLPQAWLHGCAEAAGATLIALYDRVRSGLGQHVDVSTQQAAMVAAQSQTIAAPNQAIAPTRAGGGAKVGSLSLRFVYPASDGHVVVAVLFGSTVGPYMRRLFDWIYEEGFCDQKTRDIDWIEYGMLLFTGQTPRSEYDRVVNTIADFTASKTKEELFQGAVNRHVLIAPVADARNVLEMQHFADRKFWDSVEDEDVGKVRVPGRFAIFSKTPLSRLGRPPRLGEHTSQIFNAPQRTPVQADHSRKPGNGLPLVGLKILDFAWVMAGPLATRVLADYGATVVRIESSERQDLIRALSPRLDANPSPEHSLPQQNFNAGKLGLALNPRIPQAKEVVFDLVRWADVVFDSFAPGAMKSWGFDYDRLSQINPKIVQVSSSLMGQWGPLASFAGFGNLAAAISGYYEVTGWPDRDPVGPFSAYTDSLAPRFAVMAILAAVEHVRQTGKGQFVDLSQAESALHFYTPALLEFQVNGRIMTRSGNADPYRAPHGAYPAAGDDKWIAIACETDQHWQSLCAEMNRKDLATDKQLSTLSGRLRRAGELDKIVANWTGNLEAAAIQAKLQSRGIPAHLIATSQDCAEDPQLSSRDHFVSVSHPMHGKVIVEGTRFKLSRTPAVIKRGGPTLGQHIHEVLSGILGYDEQKIADIVATGAME
jgi:crotonobetainyl-CoA:carnitine CoA-transferase CaiB-like acyl-CoA transferase